MTAVSPSTTDTDFAGAVKGLAGEKQAKFMAAAAEIDHGLGIDSNSVGVVGAWQDGAENTLVTKTQHASWDQLATSAAMKAHLTNQKAALVFQGDPEGHSVLYSFHAKGEVGQIHSGLLEDGVSFHSLEPDADGQGATVHVADLDGSAYEGMAKSAERFNARVQFQFGKAAFIGSEGGEPTADEQRAAARKAYEGIIGESKVPGAGEVWARVHSGWGQALADGVEDEPRDERGRWTGSANFKSWFGQSKGVDEAGRPKVFYHGTARDFSEFDLSHAGEGSGSEKAIFLSPNADVANHYAEVQGAGYGEDPKTTSQGQVYPVYLSYQNPFVSKLKFYNSDQVAGEIKKARKGGHDAIEFPHFASEFEKQTVAVFDPRQIKSAIGNKGTFDPKSPRLTDAQANLGFLVAGAAPSARVCHAASVSALATICDGVSQRAHSHVSAGLLSGQRPAQIARLLDQAFGEGLKRSRMLAEHAVTQAYSQATLDAMEARGVTHVGTISEHSHQLTDYSDKETRDPAGRWSSGTGGEWQAKSAEEQAAFTKRVKPAVRNATSGEVTVGHRGQTHKDLGFNVESPGDNERGFYDPKGGRFHSGSDVPLDSSDLMTPVQKMRVFGRDADLQTAAGIMFLDPDDKALFLHRTDGQGWAWPGGGVEPPEGLEQGAVREAQEELGGAPLGPLTKIWRSTGHGVDFHTFSQDVPEPFTPTLNEEHDDWTWAPLDQPPSPLHPGVREMLRGMGSIEDVPDDEDVIVVSESGRRFRVVENEDGGYDVYAEDAARQSPQPQHPRTGQFAKAHVVARERRRSKSTGQFRRQGLAYQEQRKEELTEARFGRIKGKLDVVTAGDDKVCPTCDAISENGPYTINEARSLIPAHPNAVLEGSTFASFGPAHEMARARFMGPAIELRTSAKIVTIGPNHPMLTKRGFVRAADLKEGDELLHDLRTEGATSASEADFEQVAMVEDVFEAAGPSASCITGSLSSANFHGDEASCYGEVEVIRAKQLLTPVLDPCGIEQFGELVLPMSGAELQLVALLGAGQQALGAVFLASSRGMGGGDLALPIVSAHVAPFEPFLVGCRSTRETALAQDCIDNRAAGSILASETDDTGPACIADADVSAGCFRWHRVLDVRHVLFDGWAFDASTSSQLYLSDGYVVHNCRCLFTPARSMALDFSPDQPRDESGRWSPLSGSQGHPAMISSRNITAKRAAGDASGTYQRIDIDAMKQDPGLFKRNVDLFKNGDFYPGMRPGEVKGGPDEIAQAVKQRLSDNLVFLANKVKTEEPQNFTRWAGWYDGANTLAKGMAKEHGIDLASASGTIAALSPQNDWNANVYQAGVVMDSLTHKQGAKWDDTMSEVSGRIWKGALAGRAKEIEGKTLGELAGDDPDSMTRQAMWIRTENEAHSDRSFRLVHPEGTLGDVMKTQTGAPARAAWKATPSIVNAIAAFRSGGDNAKLGDAMGEKHKVRSFYNNILDPHSPNGDVTIDTHAVGAAWLSPMTASDMAVVHDLGSNLMVSEQPKGYKATGKSSITGVSGTYAVYADAYRDAAKKLKIEPRQLQSVVWEAKQRLFSATQTGPKVKAAVDSVWRKFHSGAIGLKEAQNAVVAATSASLGQ
jgi:8-oxo-dGTP pyrophosphatase MutT (NUDIX family)